MNKLKDFGRLTITSIFVCVLFLSLAAHGAPAGVGRRDVGASQLASIVAGRAPSGHLPATNELTLAVGLALREPAGLTAFIHDLYDPASPAFHQYLSCEQFTERFGPSAADYQAVISFAASNGLAVVKTYPNRVLVDVRGKVTDIEKAFGVKLLTYRHPSEARDFYAPDTNPTVDASVPILAVRGLENYDPPRPMHRAVPLDKLPPRLTDGGTGPSGTYMGTDFRNAYAPGVTNTGAGQIVGLFEQDGYYAADITFYESYTGLPSVTLSNVVLGGFNGNPTTNADSVDEVSLDIEMAIAMAPGLSQVRVYEAPTGSAGAYDILNQMATDNLAKQLSSSWVIDRIVSTPVPNQLYQEYAAQGQSFFQSSGDQDAYAPGIYQIAGNPNLTIVGGTELTTASAGGPWSSETVWQAGAYTGTGGGISTSFGIPDYQLGINVTTNMGSTTNRNVPDVALTADNIYIRANNGSNLGVGGTSAATPLWAGFAALANQQAVAAGKPTVGFINPAIYALGQTTNYTNCFHDITTGNNTNPASPTLFYAIPGYDLCTGWGTPAGSNLINALVAPAVAPQFTYWTNGGTITITRYGGSGGAVTIPSTINGLPVTGIGDYAFYEWNGLSSVTIPSSVTNIGADAFAECPNLASVFFTGNAPSLNGTNVFGGDTGATVYYELLTSGWSSTYGGRPTSLWTPQVPAAISESAGVITIVRYLGSGGAVTIPAAIDGFPVEVIGGTAFAGTAVSSVTIPASIIVIGDYAFYDCPGLTSVYCEGNAPAVGGPNVFVWFFIPPYGTPEFDPAVVFYSPATSGWSSSYDGLPTAPLYVSNTSDNGAAGSLRETIAQVPAGWLVTFAAGLSGQTILLTNGPIALNNSETIDASALASAVQINGNHASQIFNVAGGVTALLKSLVLANGYVTGGNIGGAIYSAGSLSLSNCTLSSNATDSSGTGGAIFNEGTLALTGCTLSGNSAGFAGAIANYATCTLVNCTFNGNSAPNNGGAIDNDYGATLSALHCTFSGNSAGGAGGGIDNYLSVVSLTNTIVGGNTGQDIYNWSGSTVSAGGTNIVQVMYNAGTLTGAGSILSVAPVLAALGGYGGPTATMPPLPGSPAINAGSVAAAAGLAFDQRGLPRSTSTNVDIGAVELQSPFPVVTTASDSGPGSLRQLAGAVDVSATITFANNLSGKTILLTGGAIGLAGNLVIDGSGLTNGIQLNGNSADRIFNVGSGANVVLNSLTITNGLNTSAAFLGGGIGNDGSLTVNKCTFTGNSAGLSPSYGYGGGIENNASLIVNESTFTGNSAYGGGAIASQGPVLAVNECTITGNADEGGYSPGGGAIVVANYLQPTITNSIVAGNLSSGSPGDISIDASVQGAYDLIGAGGGLVNGVNGNQVGVNNPQLATLGNYGGPTPTMPPLPGSPAIGAGSVAAAGSFATDQRGLPRVVQGKVDIGAVELQQISPSGPPRLVALTLLANGAFEFSFTNATGASFTVFASTNVELPFNAWSNLGTAVETPVGSGQFQFTDPQATNNKARFYRVRSP